jgi:hypothetical protein
MPDIKPAEKRFLYWARNILPCKFATASKACTNIYHKTGQLCLFSGIVFFLTYLDNLTPSTLPLQILWCIALIIHPLVSISFICHYREKYIEVPHLYTFDSEDLCYDAIGSLFSALSLVFTIGWVGVEFFSKVMFQIPYEEWRDSPYLVLRIQFWWWPLFKWGFALFWAGFWAFLVYFSGVVVFFMMRKLERDRKERFGLVLEAEMKIREVKEEV